MLSKNPARAMITVPLLFMAASEELTARVREGGGRFVVVNKTGAALTIEIEGPTPGEHTVSGATSTIRLAPGKYNVKVSARCGDGTESFDIRTGTQYTGTYSCETRTVRRRR